MLNISETGTSDTLRVIPRPRHNVSRSSISRNALKVLYRLKDAGYQAFLVGGGVRDLLLGREPKDFDIATDAHPDEVRELFRNCRLIGRRFRLAHVFFGPEVVEVATFRAAADDEDDGDADADGNATSRLMTDSGRIIRDNVYGSIDEDAWRRDFTANALYYNIADFSIWDYVGGVEDIHAGVLRVIGEPDVRFREDPVRMLRAVRFAAKLGFRLHSDTERSLHELASLIAEVSPARLLDEIMKLFFCGHALQSFELLRQHHLFDCLFPMTERALNDADNAAFRQMLTHAIGDTDARVAEGRPVGPSWLFAVFLWDAIRCRATELIEEGVNEYQAIHIATEETSRKQQRTIALPRRFVPPMRDMLALQPRFRTQKGARVLRLLDHPSFRAAYDFLLLRVAAGIEDAAVAEWWTEIQELGPQEQAAKAQVGGVPRRRRSGTRRRRPRARQGA
ncbi:polynucleotide adenylyltransferase PcnB [soil metagenome]